MKYVLREKHKLIDTSTKLLSSNIFHIFDVQKFTFYGVLRIAKYT